jgi:small GTP-binding protein
VFIVEYRTFKICIVGDGGVGKTTIVHRYVDNIFLDDTKITIGTNLFVKRIDIPSKNRKATLQIWDLGGESRFDNIRRNFYAGANGIIYTFDLTRRFSLMNLNKWQSEIEKAIGAKPSVLIGNKLDLVRDREERPIPEKEGKKVKDDLGCSYYLETSAKEDVRIDKAFLKLSERILDNTEDFEI